MELCVMTELINSNPDFTDAFSDERIGKRANIALNKLTTGRNSSIRRITSTDAEQKSFYRLLNNGSFTEEGIINTVVNRCGSLCSGRHVLCIQDTTEFNLNHGREGIKKKTGLGRTTKEGILGFMLHSSLVVDAARSTALGYSSVRVWERDEDGPDRHERKYKQQPIEQKESYKWIESARQSKELLLSAEMITVVADRESDMYDLIGGGITDARTHLLIRSSSDRKTVSGVKLSVHLNSLPVMHTYELEVRGDVRKNIAKRRAVMELKWSRVLLARPSRSNGSLPETAEISVVEAREQGAGSKGIYWRLLTTHPVNCRQEAVQITEWYKQRWHIEQMHRLMKTQGMRIESAQLKKGWAIRKLTLLSMMAVLRILQMMLAYEDDREQDIDEVFTEEEQQCLQMINEQQQGSTEKQKNKAVIGTVRWATWVIARLGGWKGYQSAGARKPGPIVLQQGLAKFYAMYEGWKMFKNNMAINVASP